MKRLRSIKPTPSMVVAGLALLVALSGTGIAAVAVAVPRNSVGPLQLQANAVTSAKVKNGSLLRLDFKSGQVPAGPQGPAGPTGATGPTGPTGPAGAAGVAPAGYVAQVLTANSSAGSSTNSDFGSLGSASVSVTVPTGETDQLIAYFTGESACYQNSTENNIRACRVRILLDGNELNPTGGQAVDYTGARADQSANVYGGTAAACGTSGSPTCQGTVSVYRKTNDPRVGIAVIRISGNVAAGAHTVQVQFGTSDSKASFDLRNWALVVQRVKVA
jgi:hypothetical protein